MHRFYAVTAVNLKVEVGAILDEVSDAALSGDEDMMRILPVVAAWWFQLQRRRP